MLLTNTLDHTLFLPTVIRLGGFLVIGLIVLLIVERHRLREFGSNVLFRRWRTWLAIAVVYVFGTLSGPLPMVLLVVGITLQALREYAQLAGLPADYRRILLIMGLLPAPVAALSLESFFLLAPLLLIVATLQPILFKDDTEGIRQLAFAVLGWGYIAWFLGHMVLIHQYVEGGEGVLLALGVAVAMSDVGAYAMGKTLGKHKLSPRLSPNKTVEGTLGNFIGAYAGVILMAYAMPPDTHSMMLVVLPALIGATCIWGDLLESAIKREFGEKDAGKWLPGFGGILDRIDSLIISLPLVLYVFWLAR
jgi:phosphatidate cytidylyltransferase